MATGRYHKLVIVAQSANKLTKHSKYQCQYYIPSTSNSKLSLMPLLKISTETCKNELQALSSYPPKFPSLEYNTSHQDCLATNSEFQLANSLITVKILFFRLSFEIDCNGRATGALDAAGTTNWPCGIVPAETLSTNEEWLLRLLISSYSWSFQSMWQTMLVINVVTLVSSDQQKIQLFAWGCRDSTMLCLACKFMKSSLKMNESFSLQALPLVLFFLGMDAVAQKLLQIWIHKISTNWTP